MGQISLGVPRAGTENSAVPALVPGTKMLETGNYRPMAIPGPNIQIVGLSFILNFFVYFNFQYFNRKIFNTSFEVNFF